MNLGSLLGALVSTGLGLILLWIQARKITLAKRVAPYLRFSKHAPKSLATPPQSPPLRFVSQFFMPWYRDFMTGIQRFTHRNKELELRLKRAGSELTTTEFRSQQVLWSAAGLVGGVAITVPFGVANGMSLPLMFIGVLLFPITAGLARDWFLSYEIGRRETALATQLPTIAELLALAVGAGETPLAAIERVNRCVSGELGEELTRTLADVHAGASLEEALSNLAQRSPVPAIARFCDAIAVAISRGTPLAQVLHDQARDAREDSRRKLMEISGRKEISMLVPVVFFILPITVLFAIYPGLTALRGGL